MTPNVSPDLPQVWRKAIPEARDRRQSRAIVWIGVPVLCWLSLAVPPQVLGFEEHGALWTTLAYAASAAFGFAAWRLKAATPLAAGCGAMICLLITLFSGNAYQSIFRSGLTPLLALFVLTFGATRFRRHQKALIGLAEHRKGRNAAQIIANLGMAGLFSSLWGAHLIDWSTGFDGSIGTSKDAYFRLLSLMRAPLLAALAEAAADTISSEIGQAIGGKPVLITTLRRVEPGTDGAISLRGTLAGIAAAFTVVLAGALSMNFGLLTAVVALIAGVGGLFFDSFLGATVERKGWLGNDLTNLASTAFAVALSLAALRLIDRFVWQ